jgi:hypothetical protein
MTRLASRLGRDLDMPDLSAGRLALYCLTSAFGLLVAYLLIVVYAIALGAR